MTDKFMAAYERAEERNDIQHGYFQDKREEWKEARARKKRNQRIAGLATLGAGLAAAGGIAAYQHTAKGKAAIAGSGESYKKFTAEQDAKINERKAAESAKAAEKAAKRATRVDNVNQKVSGVATKLQNWIRTRGKDRFFDD